ncbi:antibiotic biosynthesis monooxygenase [Advenella sp. WQ 585]|uniref:Antibiotic biosynthesis monooxygenase n=1 Tax=Advenella mandrilli TaxID=2800330 RepID=A0ABS1E822_9BURK|nr:putative quinol monooxygenase [Advenella mandrilli]MBK1779692.1 antibiotic biosynthesis monooxygenase [Advenella mandrilli]
MFGPGYYVTAQLKTKEGVKPEVLRDALEELCAESLKEPGCSVFFSYQDSDNPAHFVLWERFENEEAFKAHEQEVHTKKYGALGLSEIVNVIRSSKVFA